MALAVQEGPSYPSGKLALETSLPASLEAREEEVQEQEAWLQGRMASGDVGVGEPGLGTSCDCSRVKMQEVLQLKQQQQKKKKKRRREEAREVLEVTLLGFSKRVLWKV